MSGVCLVAFTRRLYEAQTLTGRGWTVSPNRRRDCSKFTPRVHTGLRAGVPRPGCGPLHFVLRPVCFALPREPD